MLWNNHRCRLPPPGAVICTGRVAKRLAAGHAQEQMFRAWAKILLRLTRAASPTAGGVHMGSTTPQSRVVPRKQRRFRSIISRSGGSPGRSALWCSTGVSEISDTGSLASPALTHGPFADGHWRCERGAAFRDQDVVKGRAADDVHHWAYSGAEFIRR